MPGKLLGLVSRSKPAAQNAKNMLKSSLHNVAKGTTNSISLNSSEKLDKETMELLKRHSITLGGKHTEGKSSSKNPRSSSSSLETSRVARLDMLVESPPLLSFNRPSESSGALFSGQLRLHVQEPSVVFDTIEIRLLCTVTYKRPVDKYCAQCGKTEKELKKWSFLQEPLSLTKGEHRFPVSYLFDGELPASTHAHHLGMLDYHFSAIAKTTNGDIITFADKVDLGRAIVPGHEKQSIRVFPPTNITANVTIQPVVHAAGNIPVTMRLTGLTSKSKEGATVRWRLRRLNWRLEEHQKLFSPACEKHLHRPTDGKTGVLHEEIRTIGEHEVNYSKNPWKADYAAGEIDSEFTATINPSKKPVCDVADESLGLSICHLLIVEMVVAEEWIPNRRSAQPTPTGAARILRAQFPFTLSLRAGLGIAWDEEIPPVYQDVPASPPCYQGGVRGGAEVEDFDLHDLDDEIEGLHLGEPTHDRARAGTFASTSSVRTASTASSSVASRRLMQLSADDLLQEPPYYRRNADDEE